jgi:hypothetical protein
MASPTEQYTESLKKSQEAVLEAMQAWTKNAQSAFSTPVAGLTGPKSADQVIDQVFDFAEQMLAVQRQFAKNLASLSPTEQSKS